MGAAGVNCASLAGVVGGADDGIRCPDDTDTGFGGGDGGTGDEDLPGLGCWAALFPPNTFWRFRSFGPFAPRDGGRSNLGSPRSGMADGGGADADFSIRCELENNAVMSSDFFLRPAHARFRRPPVLDVVLGAGESGGGLTVGRDWPWPMLAREAVRGGADVRTRGKNRPFEDEDSEDTERSDAAISDWLELEGGAAGRRSEEALEEDNEDERELEEREVGTLLEKAWVSVVRGCDGGILGILPDTGREGLEENDKDMRVEEN